MEENLSTTCPDCGENYNIEEEKLPRLINTFHCTKCGHLLRLEKTEKFIEKNYPDSIAEFIRYKLKNNDYEKIDTEVKILSDFEKYKSDKQILEEGGDEQFITDFDEGFITDLKGKHPDINEGFFKKTISIYLELCRKKDKFAGAVNQVDNSDGSDINDESNDSIAEISPFEVSYHTEEAGRKNIFFYAALIGGVILAALLLIFLYNIVFSKNAKAINSVKNGKLKDYPSMKIENAFDNAFDRGKWKVVKLPAGEPGVQFTGNISEALHDSAVTLLKEEITAFQLKCHSYQNIEKDKINSITKDVVPQSDAADERVQNEWLKTRFWTTGSQYILQFKIPRDADSPLTIERFFTLGDDVIGKEIKIEEVKKVIYSVQKQE